MPCSTCAAPRQPARCTPARAAPHLARDADALVRDAHALLALAEHDADEHALHGERDHEHLRAHGQRARRAERRGGARRARRAPSTRAAAASASAGTRQRQHGRTFPMSSPMPIAICPRGRVSAGAGAGNVADTHLDRVYPQTARVRTQHRARRGEGTHLCIMALARSRRVASVEMRVVICPVECFARARPERRSDLRNMSDITCAPRERERVRGGRGWRGLTPARMVMPFVMVSSWYWFVARLESSARAGRGERRAGRGRGRGHSPCIAKRATASPAPYPMPAGGGTPGAAPRRWCTYDSVSQVRSSLLMRGVVVWSVSSARARQRGAGARAGPHLR